MIDNTGEIEFEVLGLKVKFRPEEQGAELRPIEVVEYLKRQANDIRFKNPSLKNDQLAVLVGLRMAEELLAIRKEYREKISELHHTAKDALHTLEFL